MKEILGGISEWLHENGVRTNFDVAYQVWRHEAGLVVAPRLVIYSVYDKSDIILWIDGTSLMLLKGCYKISFELADPGFLDDLLSKVR